MPSPITRIEIKAPLIPVAATNVVMEPIPEAANKRPVAHHPKPQSLSQLASQGLQVQSARATGRFMLPFLARSAQNVWNDPRKTLPQIGTAIVKSMTDGTESFKAGFLDAGVEITAKDANDEFKRLWPGEEYETAGKISDHEYGYAVFNMKTLHAVLVRSGEFIPVSFQEVDGRFVGFIYGRMPGRKHLATTRLEMPDARHKAATKRAVETLLLGGKSIAEWHEIDGKVSDPAERKILGIGGRAIESEGYAVSKATGKSLPIAQTELGEGVIELDTGIIADPKQLLRATAAMQEEMATIARESYDRIQEEQGIPIEERDEALVVNVASPIVDGVEGDTRMNNRVDVDYGGYIGAFEGSLRRFMGPKGSLSRKLWEQVAKHEDAFESVKDMLAFVMGSHSAAWWNPAAAQYNEGLPNVWTPDQGIVAGVINFLGFKVAKPESSLWQGLLQFLDFPRGRFTVPADVAMNATNLTGSQWVMGFTQMLNLSAPFYRGIVPDLGDGVIARDTRLIMANDTDTSYNMNRPLNNITDLLRFAIENIVMGRVDRVARAFIKHFLNGEKEEFPDSKGTMVSKGKTSAHAGLRFRGEVHGDFNEAKAREENTRPSNAGPSALSRGAIHQGLFNVQGVIDADAERDSLEHLRTLADGKLDGWSREEIFGDGNHIAMLYNLYGPDHPDHPEVKVFLDILETIVRNIDNPAMLEEQGISLASIESLRTEGSLADLALNGRGTLGGAGVWELRNRPGGLTDLEWTLLVAAFQEQQREHIKTRTDEELDAYYASIPGSGFIFVEPTLPPRPISSADLMAVTTSDQPGNTSPPA